MGVLGTVDGFCKVKKLIPMLSYNLKPKKKNCVGSTESRCLRISMKVSLELNLKLKIKLLSSEFPS